MKQFCIGGKEKSQASEEKKNSCVGLLIPVNRTYLFQTETAQMGRTKVMPLYIRA